MNNSNDTSNFFDSKTIGAIVMVFAVWMGWQYYMQQKYPQMFVKKTQATPAATPATVANTAQPATSTETSKAESQAAKAAPAPATERTFDFQSKNLSFQISSIGMGLKNVKLLKYTNRQDQTQEFSEGDLPHVFATRLLGSNQTIPFAVEKVSDNIWSGHAQIDGMTITKTIEIDPEKYKFDVKISAVGQSPKFMGLITDLSDTVEPVKSSGFLNRSQERQEAFVDTTESHKNHIYFANDLIDKSWNNGHIVALGSQYFTQALLDHSGINPEIKLHMDPAQKVATMQLEYPVVNRSGDFNVHYTGMIGPKSVDLLRSIDEELVPVVDFGFFAIIARYMATMLRGFFSFTGNWAVAIVLLTVVVRLIVLPFNIISYRSMKTMQILQPQMKVIKERYKDDQQRANQEVMNLFKQHKVNPAGGCLPMILQLPIFWAFYQVLGHSIELYKQPFPFNFWIHDLSLKDPYYILPILMGVTMFAQQMITPNPSVDPNQAKMMKFMPLLFSFFMISLPSGMTLYIFVSSLFAVIQQTYFMKSHNPLVEKLEGVR